MARFAFASAGEIIFGEGTLAETGKLAAGFGRRALVTAGRRGADLDRLLTLLADAGVEQTVFDVHGEPDVDLVRTGVDTARSASCDVLIGFGGGSAIDAAKAISALLTNPGDPLDYLEVVGKGKPLTERAAPVIAVPTTAGTGAEVTRNAVLAAPAPQEKQAATGALERVKVSLRSPLMLPRVALVDPELTYRLPPEITASTGMDALAQVIEPYVSARANPLADLFCREGIARGGRSLLRAYRDGAEDTQARRDMAFTSLMGGLALANAGLGAVHGFAGVVGGMFPAPHGAVCAALLPPVVAANARALRERAPQHPALERYAEIARMVTGEEAAGVEDLVRWLKDLREALGIPGLGTYGVNEVSAGAVVEMSAKASSMKANPIPLTREELAWILAESIGSSS